MATAMMSSQGSQHSIDAKHAEFRPSFGGGFPLGADHVLDETASQPENIKDSPISPRGSSHGSFQSKDLEMSESKDDDDDDAQEAQPRDSSLDDQPPSGADAKELDMSCPTTSKNLLPVYSRPPPTRSLLPIQCCPRARSLLPARWHAFPAAPCCGSDGPERPMGGLFVRGSTPFCAPPLTGHTPPRARSSSVSHFFGAPIW